MAHDFNNLLVAIHGHGELAPGRVGTDDATAREHISSLLLASDRTPAPTKQLLAFARRQVLNREVLDLNEVVEETDALLGRVLGDGTRFIQKPSAAISWPAASAPCSTAHPPERTVR